MSQSKYRRNGLPEWIGVIVTLYHTYGNPTIAGYVSWIWQKMIQGSGMGIDDAIEALESHTSTDISQYQYNVLYGRIQGIIAYMNAAASMIRQLMYTGHSFEDALSLVEDELRVQFSEDERLWLLAHLPD